MKVGCRYLNKESYSHEYDVNDQNRIVPLAACCNYRFICELQNQDPFSIDIDIAEAARGQWIVDHHRS